MSRGMNRAERLREMERLYIQRGFTDIEMADRLGVDRTTVWKDRTLLEDEVPFIKDASDRWRIDRTRYLSAIRVTVHEALALYLATRRASRQTRYRQPHTAGALSKLASALRQPMTERLVKAADKIAAQNTEAGRVQILETITEAWVEQRKVNIVYRALNRMHGIQHTVHPYFIEPSLWSDSNYLVGYSERTESIVPFKTDRIERASLNSDGFELPATFDDEALLRHAWGIWFSENEPVTVRLQFRGNSAVRRLKESIWHPLEELADQPDGSCVWSAPVDEWHEMLPWIRGWGADVKVLEPEELRLEIEENVRRMAASYQLPTTPLPPHLLPYAKTDPASGRIHRLLYHLIDVGQVALILWQEALTPAFRRQLATVVNLDLQQAGQLIAFLAALHDLGKAGPAYQSKYAPASLQQELTGAGLILRHPLHYSYKTQDPATSHALVSTWALQRLLPDMLGMDARFAARIATALGGHHGAWPAPLATDNIDDSAYPLWEQVRRDLIWELDAVFRPPRDATITPDKQAANSFLTLFSGLVSVADWLGSRNEECFGFVSEFISTRSYAARSAGNARRSLQDLGWMDWQPTSQAQTFSELFGYLNIGQPHPAQSEAISTSANIEPPFLLILEAPTGIGKTEAALYIADRLLQQRESGSGHSRGLYVAMPTMATSNQMYERVGKWLTHRFPGMKLNYHLLHSQAAWQDVLQREVSLQTVGDDEETGVSAMSWFRPRKRTLLGPFAVGTVDQALMSILQTRHFFVRLFGLSHKVIIFDEVHAYDVFMSTLFHRLLEWLSAVGSSVIILSATLSASTRRQLVEAYAGRPLSDAPVPYPALTIAGPAIQPNTISLAAPPDSTLYLDWSLTRSPAGIVACLRDTLSTGGCAAVICNTVGRAQEIYRALQQDGLDLPPDNLILFHARFPPVWRSRIEQRVLGLFGKEADRPAKAVVVATQVIEQSLDLDFDLMITDLAPIDLLIQRAGRLHRHRRGPRSHARRLFVARPDAGDDGLPSFGSDSYIYEPYVLWRTYLALRQRSSIAIPAETTALIESVYGPIEPLVDLPAYWRQAVAVAHDRMVQRRQEAESKARRQLVLPPTNARLLAQTNMGLEEDQPDIHAALRAQTRDMEPGVEVVCLWRGEADRLFVVSEDGPVPLELQDEPAPPLTRILLQNVVTLRHRAIFNYFLQQESPAAWRRNPSLRGCRPAIFVDGLFAVPETPYFLRLTPELGLEIIKQETT